MNPGRWPYQMALAAVKAQAARLHPHPRVWPRNSFLTSAFRPLRSDLDLTIWFEEKPSSAALDGLQKILKRSKRAFPALGESNIYFTDMASRFAIFANRFELARDPELARRLPAHDGLTSARAESCAYLLRMLDANLHKLTSGWGGQEGKWRQHFANAGVAVSEDLFLQPPIKCIIENALSWVPEACGDDLFQRVSTELNWYFLSRAQGCTDGAMQANPILNVLMPQRFCYFEYSLELLDTDLAEIFIAQIAWEIWGLAGQVCLYNDFPGLISHLRKIDGLLAEVEAAEFPLKVRAGLADLIDCAQRFEQGIFASASRIALASADNGKK